MKQSEFIHECNKRTIAPAIALENEAVSNALKERDDLKVIQALDSEF